MKLTTLLSITPYFVVLTAQPVLATTNNEDPLTETIVITATAGRGTTTLEAPATLTVIEGYEQNKYQMTGDIGDLLIDVPGVNVSAQSNGSRGVRIRGLSNDYTQVLLNGQRSYTKEALWRGSDNALSQTPSVAVDRIEVIRGPMSTLYGADTIGGVVNVISRKHNGSAEAAVSVESQYNQGDESGNGQIYGLYFSTPISDAISYTVYGNYLDIQESFYDAHPDSTKRRSQQNYNLVNTVDFQLNEQHALDLELQLSNEQQLGTSMFRGRAYQQDRTLQRYTLGYGYQSSAVNVKSHVYYSDFDVAYNIATSDIVEQNYGADIQAAFFVDQHTITVGAETHDAQIENTHIAGGSTDRNSAAAFIEASLAVGNATNLTLGGRVDRDSLFDSEFTYRGYITHTLNDNWHIKTGVSSAFKAPTMAQISPSYSAPASGPACPGRPARCSVYGNPELSAETGTFTEFGVYYANDTRSVNATLFNNQVDDIIKMVTQPNGRDGYYSFVNVDKAKLKGLELAAKQQFSLFDIDLAYTYLDAKDDMGEELLGTSKHEATLKANWFASANMDVFARMHYRSKVIGELGRHDVADAYTTVDLGIRYNLLAELNLKLGVNNVANKDISSPDTYTEVLQGRTYYAGLSYEF
ncbi:TonB-dependent receptor plug domain-containing protein [Pseudoalteromonas sp.]|uniref:TonB-dependent receptor plug domain-containing protein n=1 Tax=Pseudoalteromonas sp. TaxID=53249 RepID=UPI00356B34E0